ncbi:MAG: hypothetical protein JNM89_05765 [Hyphomicrobiaceae bacterium]|nr:hypothetical protein [Hyphomicrobiaceae bacterium]
MALAASRKSAIGRAIIQLVACYYGGPAGCAAISAALTVAAGGSVVDAVTSAAVAFAQIPVWNEVGNFLVQTGMAASAAATALVHGVVGGAMSMVQGGSSVQGFAANAIGAFGADVAGGVTSDIAPHTAIVAAAGCAAAAATGGKCAEGATTAAFANLFNHFAHKEGGAGQRLVGGQQLAYCAPCALPVGQAIVDFLTVVVGGWSLYDNWSSAPADAEVSQKQQQVFYHYTSKTGMEGILSSQEIFASSQANNPRDALYGTGVYVSDIVPGTMRSTQLARAFLGQPFPASRFTHYVAIETSGLGVIQGRQFVYLIPRPTGAPLPVMGRIVGFGAN